MKIKKKYIIIFIILLIILLYYQNTTSSFIDQINEFNKKEWTKLVETPNPYFNNEKFLWLNPNNKFIKNNWPTTPDFDLEIKQDIMEQALKLPKGYCIIDCGAHMGDGSIPIALALTKLGRQDIIVYAIDPSKYKCDLINYVSVQNKINNLIVINCGLSDENFTYYKKESDDINSGAAQWTREIIQGSEEKMEFKTLDSLGMNNIGIIHLDVEGMEINALKGAQKSIYTTKPYLSIENNLEHKKNNNYYLDYLPQGYKWVYNKRENNCFKYY